METTTFWGALFFFCLSFGGTAVQAQYMLQGQVQDATGQGVPFATVRVPALPNTGTVADAEGHFALPNLPAGPVVVVASFIGLQPDTLRFSLPLGHAVRFRLLQANSNGDEVVVMATRPGLHVPATTATVAKTELESQNLGQDLPLLLQTQTAVVATSDAGNGIGYTNMRIRGSDPTRINFTVNGLPLNEADAHGVYWVDLPDFASSVNNIQITRGIGTSTGGAGAFGASVNIQTNELNPMPYVRLNANAGSFGTLKSTLRAGTGMLGGGWVADVRLSRIQSNGYIERATAGLRSLALSTAHYGKRTTWRLNIITGAERTYQAWNGVPKDSLPTHRRYNPFTYPDQTDNYQQDRYQLFSTTTLPHHWVLNLAAFYTRGLGYYEEYQTAQALSAYSLPNIVLPHDTLTTTDLIRRRWLLNDFFGGVGSLLYASPNQVTELVLGGGANRFNGNYFGQVAWAQFASTSTPQARYYDQDYTKTDYNAYAHLTQRLAPRLFGYVDVQGRYISQRFIGLRNDLTPFPERIQTPFLNPKAGLSYEKRTPRHTQTLYASLAQAHREPIRDDYVKNPIAQRPSPETLTDVEAGYRIQSARGSFGATIYRMHYRNQLVLTGRLNDVGEYIRQNTPNSQRIGVELEAAYRFSARLSATANVALSRNTIATFTEYGDAYDSTGAFAGNAPLQTYRNTAIAFSPSIVSAVVLTAKPVPHLAIDWVHKFVGRQFLDNTASTSRQLNGYYVSDIRLNYELSALIGPKNTTANPAKPTRELRVQLLVNNIFNRLYESNGYAYRYLYTGAPVSAAYYYPQAGINVLAGVIVGL